MGEWTPKAVTKVIRVLTTSTRPMLVETDLGDGWVKLPDNPEGPHALAGEVIGTLLAEWLGLSIFDFGAVSVPALDLPDGGKCKPGLAFAARHVAGQPWGGDDEQLRVAVNSEDVAGLVALDTWVRNPDRYSARAGHKPRCNVRNVFFSEEGLENDRLRLLAMDFSEAVRCGDSAISRHSCGISCQRDEHVFGLFPAFKPYVTVERLRLLADRLSAFRLDVAKGIVAQVPREWDLTERCRESVAEFLAGRAVYLTEQIVTRVMGACTAGNEGEGRSAR
ncbi:MAG: HipA family kinase [Polyangiaceae bacterium]